MNVKLLLISVNKEKAVRPVLPIGMVTVAAQVLKAGHEVDCLDLCFEVDDETCVKKKIKDYQPDVIGISIRNIDSQSFLEPIFYSPLVLSVVEWSRSQKPDSIIVLGGAGFSQVPQELLQYTNADYGILSFAEKSMGLFMDRLSKGQSVDDVEGIIYISTNGSVCRKEPTFEMDYANVEPPARQFYDKRYFSFGYQTQNGSDKVVETVQSKKGCVLECVFCSNFVVDGTGVTLKSVQSTVDEIERIVQESEVSGFEFVDSVFNLPLRHALNICREMEARKIYMPWTCMLNPGAVTEELVASMAKTGCKRIDFGTDSCSDPILKILKKKFTKEKIIRSHHIVEKFGIEIMHCVFIGNPGDTKEAIRETLDVMDQLVPNQKESKNHVYLSLGLRICKGTELHRMAIEQGVLRQNDDLGVPRFYVAPGILESDDLLDEIEQRVVAHKNWYLWWGLPNLSLKERVRQVQKENKKMEKLYLETLQLRGLIKKERHYGFGRYLQPGESRDSSGQNVLV